jgi:hypothetical protein
VVRLCRRDDLTKLSSSVAARRSSSRPSGVPMATRRRPCRSQYRLRRVSRRCRRQSTSRPTAVQLPGAFAHETVLARRRPLTALADLETHLWPAAADSPVEEIRGVDEGLAAASTPRTWRHTGETRRRTRAWGDSVSGLRALHGRGHRWPGRMAADPSISLARARCAVGTVGMWTTSVSGPVVAAVCRQRRRVDSEAAVAQ